ncbi:MAG: potassium transporter KefB [Bacteroidota bacterium]
MTQQNNLTTKKNYSVLLAKRMLLGAGIGLFLIGLLLSTVNNPNPAWGKLWMIRPLLIVPLAGATGGAFYHFMGEFRERGSWKRLFANLLSLLVFIIGLWLGSVLGLSGTLWN